MYPNLKKKKKEKDKKKKKESQKEKEREQTDSVRERRKEKSRERNFSLRSTEIGPWVFVGARDKVGPRNEGYAWVPKSRGFIKLQEVGSFPTLNISSLKVI